MAHHTKFNVIQVKKKKSHGNLNSLRKKHNAIQHHFMIKKEKNTQTSKRRKNFLNMIKVIYETKN